MGFLVSELTLLPQVVQTMFDMLDQSRENCEQLEEQKNELEELWKTEKDKWRVAQRVSLCVHRSLVCRSLVISRNVDLVL